jgi:predicted dehydrogenase
MEVLLIGYGSLARRRIVPALEALDRVETVHVAEMFGQIPEDAVSPKKRGLRFDDFEEALGTCREGLVYVSQPNALHAFWASKALAAGHHVIVDKPAVTTLADAGRLCELANRVNRCAAEANVWYRHPIAQVLKDLMGRREAPPLALYVTFTSPAMDAGNFRYRSDMGGGALLDRVSYAVSCGRVLLDGMPSGIHCRISPRLRTRNVETSFAVMFNYPNGSTLLAFLSIEAEYRNCIQVVGKDYALDAQRVFTPPREYEANIEIRQGADLSVVRVAAADSFALFIDEVIASIEDGTFVRHSEILLEDAEVIEAVRRSAEGAPWR